MRELREMRNTRRERKQKKTSPLFLVGLMVLSLTAVFLFFLEFNKDRGSLLQKPESIGRMVVPGSEQYEPSFSEKTQTMGLPQDEPKSEEANSVNEDLNVQGGQLPKNATNEEKKEKIVGEFTFYKSLETNLPGEEIKKETSAKTTVPPSSIIPTNEQKSFSSAFPKPSEKIYTIQVAAFQKKDQAETLIENLKQKGYPAYLQIKEGEQEENWYRVRVGRFQRKEEAKEEAKNLKSKEGFPPFITLMVN